MSTERDENVSHCVPDIDREGRIGFAEVIYCPGKTPEQLRTAAAALFSAHSNVIASRATPEQAALLKELDPRVEYNEPARTAYLHRDKRITGLGPIAVVHSTTSNAQGGDAW